MSAQSLGILEDFGSENGFGDDLIAKIFQIGSHPAAIQSEFEVTRAINKIGIPTPKAYSISEVQGHPAIVFDKIEAEQVGDYLQRRPWQLSKVARGIAQLHHQIHVSKPPVETSLKEELVRRISFAPVLEDETKEIVLSYLDTLEDGDALCHFDFQPGNILMSDGELYVVDWSRANLGPAIADVTQAYVLSSVDQLSDDIPVWFRMMIKAMRKRYLKQYLSAYAAASDSFDPRSLNEGLKRWSLPIATARLRSLEDSETPALLKIIKNNIHVATGSSKTELRVKKAAA